MYSLNSWKYKSASSASAVIRKASSEISLKNSDWPSLTPKTIVLLIKKIIKNYILIILPNAHKQLSAADT